MCDTKNIKGILWQFKAIRIFTATKTIKTYIDI